MAITVTWNGFGRVDDADSLTGWDALKISGTGGGPADAVADGQIEGTGAVTTVVSKQRVALFFDIGASNELDFTTGSPLGAEAGQFIYLWAQFLAPALLLDSDAGGFGIFLETLTPAVGQYHLWYIYGADNYAGGWKRFVLDPTKAASASAGTAIDLSSVRYFGLFADVGGTTARFDNLICDAIDVGTGITVAGTTTSEGLIADILADEETNRYGVISALNDSNTAVELLTKLTLGDTVNSPNEAATLLDNDSKIFVGEPLYIASPSASPIVFVPTVPLTAMGIECVQGAAATSITIGTKVGTGDDATGVSGMTVVGNNSYSVGLDFNDDSVAESKWYGCAFENLKGVLNWGAIKSPVDECIGNTFNDCSQFDPQGNVAIRDCNFLNYLSLSSPIDDAAILWNDDIDIKNCTFINNDAAIEHE